MMQDNIKATKSIQSNKLLQVLKSPRSFIFMTTEIFFSITSCFFASQDLTTRVFTTTLGFFQALEFVRPYFSTPTLFFIIFEEATCLLV